MRSLILHRTIKLLKTSAFLSGITLTILGCSAKQETLTILVGVPHFDDQNMYTKSYKNQIKHTKPILAEATKKFRNNNPGAHVNVFYHPNSSLQKILKNREFYGLGPDLVITSSNFIEELLQNKLLSKVEISLNHKDVNLRRIEEMYVSKEGSGFAFPIFLDSQIACGNKEIIKSMPTSLKELTELNHPFAVDTLLRDQFWLWQNYGAKETELIRAVVGEPRMSAAQKKIYKESFLRLLKLFETNKNFSMYRNYRQKLLDFKSKKIGWISCRLSDIVELRSAMGESLITSSLPQNPSTSWISVPEITLAGFGKHSTRNQRKSSLKWLEYWTDSLVYTINRRNILLHTITPKNRILINQQDSIAVSNYLEFYKKKSPFNGVIAPAAMSQLSRKNQAFYNALFYNYTASND